MLYGTYYLTNVFHILVTIMSSINNNVIYKPNTPIHFFLIFTPNLEKFRFCF